MQFTVRDRNADAIVATKSGPGDKAEETDESTAFRQVASVPKADTSTEMIPTAGLAW